MRLVPQIAKLLEPFDYTGLVADSIEILVLQPTPFCNLNCDYCYLPNRNSRKRMSLDTVKAAVQLVLDSNLIKGRLSIVWHAGEPLVLPTSYYETAFDAIEQIIDGRCDISHSFQTNGYLIDDTWCEFLNRRRVRVGLSIDGPAFLHDLHRKDRLGKPTHAQTMRGVHKLRAHGIPFHVISVITADSLDHVDAIFGFFRELGAIEIGFNIEEMEGDHELSSLAIEGAISRIERFWKQLYKLYQAADGIVQIREFRRAASVIVTSQIQRSWQKTAKQNDQVLPFRILSVDCEGGISTFSPELLGTPNSKYGDFIFGKVGQHDLGAILASETFRRVAREVMQGVRECSRACEYFSVCGGGAPANKYFENKSLTSTTTMYCRASIQGPIKVVLADLENRLNISSFQDSPLGARVPLPEET